MRIIKFRFWDKDLKNMFFRKPATYDLSHPRIVPMQFTGFTDKNGKEIYDGDILSDEVETDEGKVKSKQQVFWSQDFGCWSLDNSYNQDKTFSTSLWLELNDFKYEVVGNIYEDKTFKKQTELL